MRKRDLDAFAIEGFLDFNKYTVSYSKVIGFFEPDTKRNRNAAFAKSLENDQSYFRTKSKTNFFIIKDLPE